MTYYCKLCDETMKSRSKYKQFKSITLSWFGDSIKRSYFTLNPNFEGTDKIFRKNVNSYNIKYEEYQVQSFLNLINLTNLVRYNKFNPKFDMH